MPKVSNFLYNFSKITLACLFFDKIFIKIFFEKFLKISNFKTFLKERVLKCLSNFYINELFDNFWNVNNFWNILKKNLY